MCAAFFNYTWIVLFKNHRTTISVVAKSPIDARKTIASYIVGSQKTHQRIEVVGLNSRYGRQCAEDLETDLRRPLQILAELVSLDFTNETLAKDINFLLESADPIFQPTHEPRFSWDLDPKIRCT